MTVCKEPLPLSEFVGDVYRNVFRKTDEEAAAGNQAQFEQIARANIARFFAPDYRQQTNETGYSYEQFTAHVLEVKQRPPASFSIEFFAKEADSAETQTVVFRVVVSDSQTGRVLSLVISTWELTRVPELKVIGNRELTFAPSDPPQPERPGSLLDPHAFPADVSV